MSGVAAGSLATSVTDPDVYLAGASGGVYALIAAHLANVIFNWGEMEFPGGASSLLHLLTYNLSQLSNLPSMPILFEWSLNLAG